MKEHYYLYVHTLLLLSHGIICSVLCKCKSIITSDQVQYCPHPITQVKGSLAIKTYKTLKRPTESGDGEDIEACKQSESRLRFHPCRGNKPRETSQSSPVNKTRVGASEAFRTLPLSSPPWILPDNSQQQTSGNKVILPSQMIGSLQREPASYPQ